jgi:hypothetical protein
MTTFRMALHRDDEEVFSLKGRTHPDGTLESEEMEGTNLWPERRHISELANELVSMTSGRIHPGKEILRARLVQRIDVIQQGLDALRQTIEAIDLDNHQERYQVSEVVMEQLRLPSAEILAWLQAMDEEASDETPEAILIAKSD